LLLCQGSEHRRPWASEPTGLPSQLDVSYNQNLINKNFFVSLDSFLLFVWCLSFETLEPLTSSTQRNRLPHEQSRDLSLLTSTEHNDFFASLPRQSPTYDKGKWMLSIQHDAERLTQSRESFVKNKKGGSYTSHQTSRATHSYEKIMI
jgi:hypothetical protein